MIDAEMVGCQRPPVSQVNAALMTLLEIRPFQNGRGLAPLEAVSRAGAAIVRQDWRIVPARESALDWRFSAKTRAIMTSCREHLRRTAHSASDCPSSVDMTKTKRSKGSSKRIAAKGLLSSPDVADPVGVMMD